MSDDIESVYESEGHQGFGSECKEHIGTDSSGKYYYAIESGESDEDLYWHGPYDTRDAAEEYMEEGI
jgi:hypothetical protein